MKYSNILYQLSNRKIVPTERLGTSNCAVFNDLAYNCKMGAYILVSKMQLFLVFQLKDNTAMVEFFYWLKNEVRLYH